ncbi:tumor necrosis factor receptor superfamily member 14-like isoform X2 [Hoplias malabaricus]|uniref:tumor necrosis factor receptor superfamily member 14-like isoform X2 n=1 Tax=Hoplias malabaricus TaxID=27720 RepID=UPI0034624E07
MIQNILKLNQTEEKMKCSGETFIYFFSLLKETAEGKMITNLDIFFIIAAVFFLNFGLCYGVCARAEYEIDGECCPMCAPGNRVYRHCTEDTSTTCVPCLDSTYLDAPNGLLNCFSCAVCDPGQGLRVKTPCTRSSDTVCEPLDGHYCLENSRGSCSLATKHTACLPGQYIKQRGTAFTDTKCGECSDGTYSNGSLHICSTYTKCEDSGLTEIKPGTKVSDVECGHKSSAAVIAVPLFLAVLLLSAAVFIIFKRKVIIKHCTAQEDRLPKQETASEGREMSTVKPMFSKHEEDETQG